MEQLFESSGTFTPDKLIVGAGIEILVKGVIVKAGQGQLNRGTVISLDTAELGVIANVEDTTSQVYGILTDDLDASGSENVKSTVYITGEFNEKCLVFDTGTTLADFEVELRQLGIYTSRTV